MWEHYGEDDGWARRQAAPVLGGCELDALEHLLGCPVPKRLRHWLLGSYGEGGELGAHLEEIAEASEECNGDCTPCGVCVPFCEGPLLYQLCLTLCMHGRSLFVIGGDNYETAKAKWEESRQYRPWPDAVF